MLAPSDTLDARAFGLRATKRARYLGTSVSVFSVNGTTGALTALPFSPILAGPVPGQPQQVPRPCL
jgi:hypothetical protein